MLTDTITAVYVPHYITWNDHRSAEQIQDFIANCVHSACVFIEGGEQKEPTWKSYQTNFFGRQIQQIGYMKNAHKFYVANPQNPSVDVWFTRDQRGLISICTIGCKGWCSTLQSFPNTWKCPTLPWKICIPMALKLAAATSAHLMSQSSHRFPYPSLSHKVSF